MTRPRKPVPSRRRWTLDAHHRLFVALALAVVTFLVLPRPTGLATRSVLCWDSFAFTLTALAWIVIATRDPYEVRRSAQLEDSSATFLFVTVIAAATASLFAVGFLLSTSKNLPTAGLAGHLAASFAAIFLSWFLIHTLFALRYASAYFRGAHELELERASGGLDFPGKDSPDYLDFVYFSFVVGMTCQVSDVQISSRQMRRLALVQGLISFAFNTAILAIFVNIVAGLI